MKRNILFVDDDPIMRELFGAVLLAEPERWGVTTAESGEAALPFLDTDFFDVVVSDMRMPGMDGVALIREVKRRSPRTARIILSGVVDQKEIAESLRETHQFMPKPFRPKALRATLARISGLDAYLQDEKIRDTVAQLDTLPSFPSLYFEIMKELDAPDPSLEKVATIVAKDPGMTVKLLQIVNAASLGLARRFSNPVEAVQQLGIAAVQSLALSAHVFTCFESRAFKGFSITKLWDHGANTARIARKILEIERADAALAEDAYTAGMLHDIGKLMLANNLPEPFQRALDLTQEQGLRFLAAEEKFSAPTMPGSGPTCSACGACPRPLSKPWRFIINPVVPKRRRSVRSRRCTSPMCWNMNCPNPRSSGANPNWISITLPRWACRTASASGASRLRECSNPTMSE
jgi:response regulator RpfG family c-di-GMP phosphodiesterase